MNWKDQLAGCWVSAAGVFDLHTRLCTDCLCTRVFVRFCVCCAFMRVRVWGKGVVLSFIVLRLVCMCVRVVEVIVYVCACS